tara:strand:- start:626 stop:868 length:243 start_codon:yes stop_codon:yes gene_type:complete
MKSTFNIDKSLKMETKAIKQAGVKDIRNKKDLFDIQTISELTGFSYHSVKKAMTTGELQSDIWAGRRYATEEWVVKWINK